MARTGRKVGSGSVIEMTVQGVEDDGAVADQRLVLAICF
jgi:hypothetical protein